MQEEKKYYYYNRFLGEVVVIAEWQYDKEKKQVHYRPAGSNVWETDLAEVTDPQFCYSESDCITLAKDALAREMYAYDERQDEVINTLYTALDTAVSELSLVSWDRLRCLLGEQRSKALAIIFNTATHYDEEE